ncbi:ras-associating and dilute domain-containing protein-like [Saccoglossus kowalevskii]
MTTRDELIEELTNGTGGLEGLFERKRSSINMLTDPRVLAHLRTVHLQAQADNESPTTDDQEETVKLDGLADKIASFNRRNHLGAFQITLNEGLSYEGALRFYLEDANEDRQASKAVKLDNETTVGELIPVLIEKFNLQKQLLEEPARKRALYQVIGRDEILLDKEECPLDIALNSRVTPRFVFRMDPHRNSPVTHPETVPTPSPSNKRRSLFTKFQNIKNTMSENNMAQNSLRVCHSAELLTNGMDCNLTDDSSISSDLSSSISSSSMTGKKENKDRIAMTNVQNGGATGLLINANLPQNRKNGKNKTTRQPARNKAKKNMKSSSSMALMFQRRFSLRKRDKDEPVTSMNVELSTETATPGVLKIYGDQIRPGAEYKSVLASMRSSAVELVKEVLERYGLARTSYKEYVLCDVIGKFVKSEEKGQRWQMECVRVVEDNEKPLVLQSFWKPGEGLSRRFEVRNRSLVAEELGEIDTITSGINANARRLQLSRVKLNRSGSTDALLDCLDSEDHQDSISSTTDNDSFDKSSLQQLEPEETESNDEPAAFYNIKPPIDFPYLLTIRGFSPNNDLLLYVLNEQVSMVGKIQEGMKEANKPDIQLAAPDVLSQHCWVSKKPANRNYRVRDNPEDCDMMVSVDPLPNAKVTINGVAITKETELKPGDLVAIGHHYVFLFKDPTIMREIPQNLAWLNFQSSSQIQELSNVEMLVNLRETFNEHLRKKSQEYDKNDDRLKIVYSAMEEDDLLEKITFLLDIDSTDVFKLTPAYLICMCVEYSAYHCDQSATRKLLLKISVLVQSIAWDKTKEIANKQPSRPNDAVMSMKELFSDLQGILFWMANALEMLNHFQNCLNDYLMSPEEGLPPGSRSSLATADDEVLSVLEEVVMYTFQQTVYYLTKTLYVALPAVLDTNPFTDEDETKDESKDGVESIISIFQSTFDLVHNLHVHPQIIHQLFAYLFFFTNASLFNMLMERGTGGKFYKWSKGVQIRGNLDLIESWTQEHGLHDEAASFLKTLSTASGLLATPKVQLLHMDWSCIRREYPALNAAQVQQILSEYHLGSNKTRPRGWFPPPEEVEPALRTSEILESFNNHPPLVLPNADFMMDLNKRVTQASFYDSLQSLADDLTSVTIYTGNSPVTEPQESADKVMANLVRKELAENDAISVKMKNKINDVSAVNRHYNKPFDDCRRHSTNSYTENQCGTENNNNMGSNLYIKQVMSPESQVRLNTHGVQKTVKFNTQANQYQSLPPTYIGQKKQSYGSSYKPPVPMHSYQGSQSPSNQDFKYEVSWRQEDGHYEIKRVENTVSSPHRNQQVFVYSQGCSEFNLDDPQHLVHIVKVHHDYDEPYETDDENCDDNVENDANHTASACQELTVKQINAETIATDHNTDSAIPVVAITPPDTEKTMLPSKPKLSDSQLQSQSQLKQQIHQFLKQQQQRKQQMQQKQCQQLQSSPSATGSPELLTVCNNQQPTSPTHSPSPPTYSPPPPPASTSSTKPTVSRNVQYKLEGNSDYIEPLSLNDMEKLVEDVTSESESSEDGVTESEMDLLLHRNTMLQSPKQCLESMERLRETDDGQEDVFVVDLVKEDNGIGLGLIDGLYTPLRSAGIYVRTLLPKGAAARDGRLRLGDRILAVNGTSLVGADYQSAMQLIRNAGPRLRFMVAKSDVSMAAKITASTTC